jgi:peptidyl-prolyl cis-trans isomerase D
MFDFIHRNKRLVQGLLFLFLLPFAFFGVDSYFRSGSGASDLATVGKYTITQFEFNRALRERQDAILRLTGGRVDSALLDNRELRASVLDGLIRQRLLLDRAVRTGMAVSDLQLQAIIQEQPAFQQDGKFSFEQYEQYLRSQGRTPVIFESELRQDIMLQHMGDAFSGSVLVPRTASERLARLLEQQREVSIAAIEPEKFIGQVKLAADQGRKYYDANAEEFRVPEQARAAYVALSAESLMSEIQVDPEEVRKAYEARRSEFEAKEEREAAHILIAVDSTATGEAKKAARAKAQDIYAQIKKNPGRFAELAKKHSQDPGSADKGGDLGWFSRGNMVKAFDDAVFKMAPGEISPPVETDFGFHVIKLAGTRGGKGRSFEEVRGVIEADLKKNRVGRKYAEVAENFNNIVFEQFDSLKPAAELAKSAIRESGWITRDNADDIRLNHPKLRQAIFSNDVLKNKRNTEAVEIAPGVLVAARVIDHKPSTIRPFEEVKAAIEKKLIRQQAAQLAIQEGRELLEQVKQGKDVKVAWGAPQLVSRGDVKGLSEPVALQVFRTGIANLPAYAGVESVNGGFTLIRVSRVVQAEKIEPEKSKALAQGLRELQGQEEMRAFIESLKSKTEVRVSRAALEKQER